MQIDIPQPLFTIVGSDDSNDSMAEVEIRFLGETIGYVGGSRYEDRCREGAEQVLRDVFAPLIEAIQAHPEVDKTSRFEYGDEEGYSVSWDLPTTPHYCGATDYDGAGELKGTCNLLYGHAGDWHSESRGNTLWAAWRGPHPLR